MKEFLKKKPDLECLKKNYLKNYCENDEEIVKNENKNFLEILKKTNLNENLKIQNEQKYFQQIFNLYFEKVKLYFNFSCLRSSSMIIAV